MEFGPDTLYKVLANDGTSPYAHFRWPLPNSKPTKWVHSKGELLVCKNGIHLCRGKDLIDWLVGPAMFVAEAGGARIASDNKVVVRKARLICRVETWNEKNARLFACDCAERAMRRVTTKYGKQDRRSWKAIKVARQFARGELIVKALAAARDAAWAAARDAAGDAAWDAVREAAREAARAAAWAAAWDAAWAAARDAAWAAAWAAAWDAAGGAAGEAAWDAEREWQTQRLMEYLRGERT
jgi:hypothetical protein